MSVGKSQNMTNPVIQALEWRKNYDCYEGISVVSILSTTVCLHNSNTLKAVGINIISHIHDWTTRTFITVCENVLQNKKLGIKVMSEMIGLRGPLWMVSKHHTQLEWMFARSELLKAHKNLALMYKFLSGANFKFVLIEELRRYHVNSEWPPPHW